ncbi:hypothetical protein ABPG72_013463 [Tetrahymena utriculariae]
MRKIYFFVLMLLLVNCDLSINYINLLSTAFTACQDVLLICKSQVNVSPDFSLCNAYFAQYQKVLVQKQFQDYKSIVSRQTMQNRAFQNVMSCLFTKTNYDNYLQYCGQQWLQFIQCSQNKLCSNLYSNQQFFQKWNYTEQQACSAVDFECQIQLKQQLINQYYSNVSQEVQQFINCFVQDKQSNSSEVLIANKSLILVFVLIWIQFV